MASKGVKLSEQGAPVKRVGGARKSARVQRYAAERLQNPTGTKKDAAIAAGYGPDPDVTSIERTKTYQAIQHQIDAAIQESGFTLTKGFKRCMTAMNRKGAAHDATALAAFKTIVDTAGLKAPERMEHTVANDNDILMGLFFGGKVK